jgi:hypothetical protein
MSVCQRGKTPLPMEEFSLKMVFEYFSKICEEYSSSIKM